MIVNHIIFTIERENEAFVSLRYIGIWLIRIKINKLHLQDKCIVIFCYQKNLLYFFYKSSTELRIILKF